VVFIDSIPWESFCALAGALRKRGVATARLTAHRKERFQRLVQKAEVVVYGRTKRRITRPEDTGEPLALEWDSLDGLLPPTTIDIQATDTLAAMIIRSDDPARHFLCRVGAGHDPMALIDKWYAKELLIELGIPTPWGSRTCEATIFPVVVKARVGAGGSEVRIANDTREMAEFWDELTSDDGTAPILEAFYAESNIRFGGVAKDGILLAGSAYQVSPDVHLPLGPARTARMIDRPEIVGDIRRLVAATDYTGFLSVDYVGDVGGVALANDINPRAFASWPAMQQAGVDIIGAYLNSLDLGPAPVSGTIDYTTTFNMFTFPLPSATSRRQLLDRHKEEIRLVRQNRPIMGNTWAALTVARIESYVVKQLLSRPWSSNGHEAST